MPRHLAVSQKTYMQAGQRDEKWIQSESQSESQTCLVGSLQSLEGDWDDAVEGAKRQMASDNFEGWEDTLTACDGTGSKEAHAETKGKRGLPIVSQTEIVVVQHRIDTLDHLQQT